MSEGSTLVLDYNGNVADFKPKIPGTSKRPNYQRHLKLPDTYSRLIAQAIKESKNKMVTLHEIQAFLKSRYACFNGTYTGWKNSLRHNLSANPAFVKVLRDGGRPRGKDNYWTIDESAMSVKDREKDIKPVTVGKRKRCPIAKSENISKARALPFSIENLLRPSSNDKKRTQPNPADCVPSSTTEGYPSVPQEENIPAKRACHRVQMMQSVGPYVAPIWGRCPDPSHIPCHIDREERLPVCYSDRFRDEEFRISRLSTGGLRSGNSMLIECELEGCEMNHQEELIICQLENCNVCKPWPKVKQEPKSSFTTNPLQYIPRHFDDQGGDMPFDFSQYEIDTGRLENLRESLEVKACGGVKAARIREED